MKKEVKTEYVLNEREFQLISKCLLYCRHRYTEHLGSGITKAIKFSELETLVRDIKLLIK